MKQILFTSESVGKGHPDKICDQIADAILDKVLQKDVDARVAIEVMASNRLIVIGGEVSTVGYVDVISTAWKILKQIGYNENDFTIISNVNAQSPDINQGVSLSNGEIGAGDQGIMFGYACNETKSLMPLPIVLAHELAKKAEELRATGNLPWAKADLKTQVTVAYRGSEMLLHTVLLSVQHEANYNEEEFKKNLIDRVIGYVVKKYDLNSDFKILINPTGRFVIGGPIGDTGLTGRKIIVDTYGGSGRHGGGSFSGKDYTKVDRSGAYMARYIAKTIVAAGLASRAEVQISYAIGITQPISLYINTFNTNKKHTDEAITKAVLKTFDLSPRGIIESLDLKHTRYLPLATYGHFGREDLNVSWEKRDRVKKLLENITD